MSSFAYASVVFLSELEPFLNPRLEGDVFSEGGVWRKDSSPANEMALGRWDQRDELLDELAKCEQKMRRTVTILSLELKAHLAIGGDLESAIGQWAAGYILD